MPVENEDDTVSMSMRSARGNLNTHKPPHIPARILWPALGFPAVIDPTNPTQSDDASTCITVILLTPWLRITRKQAAAHLRFAAWEGRHTRYFSPGPAHGFTEDEIEIRSNIDKPANGPSRKPDRFVKHIYFGYDANGANGITAGLSRFVFEKYSKDWGKDKRYQYMHEIRISRAGSSRLAPGQYNVFWINSDWTDTEQQISDEMQMLIEEYATPVREDLANSLYFPSSDDQEAAEKYLLHEYEYDYDLLHEPYNQGKPPTADPQKRTEILHPLFVQSAVDPLKIGHVTDLHYSVRADVYEENLKRGIYLKESKPAHRTGQGDSTELDPPTQVDYSNWNTNATNLYTEAKKTCDILLLTGDLVDYGRGHWGISCRDQQGDDWMYHADRNWFLFYYALASGSSYQKPVYTILGNHDWRLNPYPPFAPGAPNPRSMIINKSNFSDDQLKEIIQKAHGRGNEKAFTYYYDATGKLDLFKEDPAFSATSLWQLFGHTKTLNIPHMPTETTVASVAWYLLLINPFLDYSFHLPGGYDVLMLDWAEDEDLLFPIVENGRERPYGLLEAEKAADPGPMAKSCLTDLQKDLVEDFAKKSGTAKVLGIHAPPIGPYSTWTDDLLYSGALKSSYTDNDGRSHDIHRRVLAVSPPGALAGHVANYNSFIRNRDWLIKRLRQKDTNVRLVLGGHIHRNGLFVVHSPYAGTVPSVAIDELQSRLVNPAIVQGAIPPAVTIGPQSHPAPLYVNTTSAGPRGHLFAAEKQNKNDPDVYIDPGYAVIALAGDGTVRSLEFRISKT